MTTTRARLAGVLSIIFVALFPVTGAVQSLPGLPVLPLPGVPALPLPALPGPIAFAPGDIMVSLEPGPVQWWLANGTPRGQLVTTIAGTGEGMAFDPAGTLHITRWCIDPGCSTTGNTVERYNQLGLSMGAAGSGYDCNPHDIVFDTDSTAYVGQAGCTGAILKFTRGLDNPPVAYPVASEGGGSFWIDLAPDRCTIFYTSFSANVKRYDVCAGTQLSDFNAAPLPGLAQDLRVLPDGGVLVSSGEVIARLDAGGALVQIYGAPDGAANLWAGLDLAGDGTFWAGNYYTSDVRRFDIATGAVVAQFNTGTPPSTVVGVTVKK